MAQRLVWITLALFICSCSPEHIQKITPITDQDAPKTPGTPEEENPTDENNSNSEELINYQNVLEAVMTPVCLDCHKRSLGTYEKVLSKVVPGAPDKSEFYIRVKTDMPPIEEGYAPLTAEQISLIYQWILQGANP